MKEWIEINSEEDLPKDKSLSCWWVNRNHDVMITSSLGGLLGGQRAHIMYSHYMPIEKPKPPLGKKTISEKITPVFETDVNIILLEKFKN